MRISDWSSDVCSSDLVVLGLAAHVAPGALPSLIGEVLLPDSEGELRSADQLLLPGAPLDSVLVEDSPFGIVDADFVQQVGEQALRVVGVGWGFTVVREELPSGPDHDLDAEDAWWDTLDEDPEYIEAVRDLDLVDEDRWPQALSLLVESPATRALLTDRRGYTAWWLRSNAELGGRSEEHTSELQSLMRISYAVFCLKKKKQTTTTRLTTKSLNIE